MKTQRARKLPVLVCLGLLLAASTARGQFTSQPHGPGMHPGMAMAGPYAAQQHAAQQQMMMASMQQPPQMLEPSPMDMPMGAMPADGAYYDGSAGYCPGCGGGGCDACGGFRGSYGSVGGYYGSAIARSLARLLPYGEGGCCAPRWFDIHVEAMYLTREDAGDRTVLSATRSGGAPPEVALATDDLEFDEEPSFRFTGALQMNAGTSLEFTYFGLFNWADTAQVDSASDELFSVFSGFGTVPPGGFQQTDQASMHRIEYSSTFDNYELNYRRRWTDPFCLLQGSWLMGVRFFELDEDFVHITQGSEAGMRYFVGTHNALTGFQTGADVWTCIIPGIRIGAEAKGGVYGNNAKQNTFIDVTGASVDRVSEQVDQDRASFIGEAGLMAIYRISPNITIRGGYQFLYVDGVALASENFNSTPPNIFTPAPAGVSRVATLNDNGDLFYHGATLGAELAW